MTRDIGLEKALLDLVSDCFIR
jgi:hypothetical protein